MIIVGTTLAAFVMDQKETWSSWLNNAEQIKASQEDVKYFASIEIDGRGIEPFAPLISRLKEISGTYFTFSLDDYRTSVDSVNRLRHICMGRNIITEYAIGEQATHILYLDSDLAPDPETLPKLLEMNHPLVGGEVKTYRLSGPQVSHYPFHVEHHTNTAGYLLVHNHVFNRIRWRWDWGNSDDPCFAMDAQDFLGVPTYVRKDLIGKHYPEHIGPIETRGHDMSVIRQI